MYSRENVIDPKIRGILKKAEDSEEISPQEAQTLLKVTGKEFFALQQTADRLCFEKKNDIVTFVINRNINFTNICYQGCKFCSFSVSNKNEDGYLLSVEQVREKIKQAKDIGCTEVCIQGGINPILDIDYYLNLLKTAKEVDPNIHTHAFSPQEVYSMSNLYGSSIEDTLKELKRAGLDSMPGTAAEILVDKVRKVICPNKITSSQWIDIIKEAHNLGIPTTSTIMYGHIEDLKDRVSHLEIIRELQKDTGGFTEFVPLPFVKENPSLSKLPNFPLKPSYGMADLKLWSKRFFWNINGRKYIKKRGSRIRRVFRPSRNNYYHQRRGKKASTEGYTL
jgi:FO synthase subunit 2